MSLQASLLSSVRVRTGRQPVALATGYRSPPKAGYQRRQVLLHARFSGTSGDKTACLIPIFRMSIGDSGLD